MINELINNVAGTANGALRFIGNNKMAVCGTITLLGLVALGKLQQEYNIYSDCEQTSYKQLSEYLQKAVQRDDFDASIGWTVDTSHCFSMKTPLLMLLKAIFG